MPDKQKSINSNDPGSGPGELVQLVFVNHMSNLTYFYCSVSFARQYIKECVCVCVGGGGSIC